MPTNSTSQSTPEVILYTDGACSGNPGPGGWGFILRHVSSGHERTDSGGERETTNNRMEMLAVIRGLESLTRETCVEIVSDSKYVLDGIRDWLPKWKAKGWRRTGGAIKNEELWRKLDEIISRHSIVCTYVRGHTGHTENEECDRLAREAIKKLR